MGLDLIQGHRPSLLQRELLDHNIIFTSMIGLEKADGTHLTPKGLEEHGARLFAAYKILTAQDKQFTESRGPQPLR